MKQQTAYRGGVWPNVEVEVDRRADGSLRVHNRVALDPYPDHIGQRLVHWARATPDTVFVARRGASGVWQTITYGEMLDRARRLGQALLDHGLCADRPLVILSGNDLEHASLAAAALYAGVPYAPISPPYSLVSRDFAKLRHIIGLLTPGMVYVADGAAFAKAIAAAIPAQGIALVAGERISAPAGATTFAELLATVPTPSVDAAHAAIVPDSLAKFLFTSGSTQAPKAVINTQRMLCSNQQLILQAFPFMREEPPVLVDWLPWNHTFGGNHNYGIALYNGGTLHIDDGKPMAPLMQETLRNLREISPTIYFNVPKGFEELADALPADAGLRDSFFRRLRLMFYAGAALPKPVVDRLYAVAEAHCGERVGIYTGLGMTETAPWAIGAVKIGPVAGAIGNPAPGVTLKLVPIEGKLEVRYRGPGITPGYWRAPQQTAAAFDAEGYFISGDAVRFMDPGDASLGLVFDGRIAEDFKLNTGTWVSVGPLRTAALVEGAPHVLDVVITGHGCDDVGLLIFPRLDSCRGLAGLGAQADPAQVVASTAVRGFFQAMLERLYARGTGSSSRIVRAAILGVPPSIDLGEVTDKGSVNQRLVLLHRAADVENLYADGPSTLRAGPR